MSSGNLEIVRSICEPWSRGDYGSADWADPKVEMVIADGPAPGVWHGRDGIAEGWGDFLSPWGAYRSVIEEYVELDSERVLALGHIDVRGKSSGVELEGATKVATVFYLRAGKVTRLVLYFEQEHARAELGLSL